jgi:peptidoglycan/xylan/chitin deacetylase (PgdA/CDA1 family)
MTKPVASLSLDLDNEWAYLRTRDDPAWQSYPSYLDEVVPLVLAALQKRGLRITFFVVGQDAALERNHRALRAIADAGHEIANHSMHHEPWLHLYSDDELTRELALAEEHILAATGVRPAGFRGPGYSVSPSLLRILSERGYAYDASTFPNILGPVARAYYLATGKFTKEQRARLDKLFGKWRDGLQPLQPSLWDLNGARLVEMPVTTFPILKIPFHLSYIHYLAQYSQWLATTYFSTALTACRLFGVQPSVLLHPLDFLGADSVPRLAFFPGMKDSSARKSRITEHCLDLLQRSHSILTVGDHARIAVQSKSLNVRRPS